MDRKDAAKMLTWQHILAILGKACNGNLAIIDRFGVRICALSIRKPWVLMEQSRKYYTGFKQNLQCHEKP